jgi:Clp amino terminal domain, pathogenicity island component/UvrB/uvrC motif
MFERFTDRARRVVVLAQDEARMLNHDYIGTEHVLLGLIHEGKGVAAKALESLGISLAAVREQVEETIGRGQQEAPSGHIPFTPRAKKVLELSLREALQLGHNYIGTEHILLGLIREGDGVAAQVLVALGGDLNRVREEVIQLLERYQGKEMKVAERGQRGPATRERRQLPELISRVTSFEARLSAVEQRAGRGPDTGDLDAAIAQARQQKLSAVGTEDYERAAELRDRERQLAADRAARLEDWADAHPDLPSLAGRLQQLSEEVGHPRALLRQHGIEPADASGPADGAGPDATTA